MTQIFGDISFYNIVVKKNLINMKDFILRDIKMLAINYII